jgi:hypothetical protein
MRLCRPAYPFQRPGDLGRSDNPGQPPPVEHQRPPVRTPKLGLTSQPLVTIQSMSLQNFTSSSPSVPSMTHMTIC